MQVAEHLAVAAAVGAVHQLIEDTAQLPVTFHILVRIVVSVALVFNDLLCRESKDEGVVLADLFHDLDVGAVHRAERQSAVHHELHVAGTAGLAAGRGNLLGHIGSGKDYLGVADAVILDEHNLDLAFDALVRVDHAGHIVDQPDDQLRAVVGRTGLGAENEGARDKRHIRIVFDLIVQVHHVQDIQQLALVLMQTLDLHIEDGIRIDLDTGVFQNIIRQTLLVRAFDP